MDKDNIQNEINPNFGLDSKIESVLFWKAEPVSIENLMKIFKKDQNEIEQALLSLEKKLQNGGLRLIRNENQITLSTAKEASEIIESLTKEELIKDLGKAGLETISIVLYQGPISRAEIDYIRGVNSNFILRNLMIRGLVEKVNNPKDQRSFLYKATEQLLAYLGLGKISDLPEFQKVKDDIESFKNQKTEKIDESS